MKSYYAIQQVENAKEADIYIFGSIAQGSFFEDAVSAKSIAQQIKGLDVDTINVHINSYGGSVSGGWAIYSTLLEHPARVNTYGDGFVASAALYPFLPGDNRYASNLSAYYLHQVIMEANGNAKELRTAAEEADFFTSRGIQAFVVRAGMDPEEVRTLMEGETWLTPAQALEYGIATAITQDRTPRHIQDAKREIIQRFLQPAATTPEGKRGTSQQSQRNKILQLFERSETK